MGPKRRKKWLSRFLINIGTSGKFMGEREFGMSDYLIRYVVLNFISISGAGILIGFITVRLREGKYGTVAACGVMFLIALLTITFSRMKKVKQIVPALLLMVFYGLLCITITWLGEAEGSNFLFIYMYPAITIMLLGMRLGIIFSTTLLALVSAEMFIPGFSRFSYSATVPIHLLVTYFLVFSVMVTIETTRQTKDRLIAVQTKRLNELKEEAEMANRTKGNFLASMSHEIRTPMNAIVGMSELLLRGELPGDSRAYAQDIKHASSNLISIINDILDFSKIEAGKLEIVPMKYLLSSLVNDAVSIIRMRLMEKPVRFYTNIDAAIPNGLVGDEVRLRQVFLNLLSNSVKYTDKGHISVTITADRRTEDEVWLRITVADTGRGMKEEDQAKLFSDFTQVDTKKNRSIEGTGLGLAITKRLCTAMGGDVSVESEYGKGSAFTVLIPQGIHSDVPFAVVDDPANKKVLVYEGRKVYADSVSWSLANMKVPHTLVANDDEFAEALRREDWSFVFSGYGLYEKIKPVLESHKTEAPDTETSDKESPGRKKPPLALMVEWGTETFIPDVRFLSLPVQSLSIANILNGKADSKGYYHSSESLGLVRFTIPNARLLIVDDIPTNLKVAEGLLAPYNAQIEICLSGMEAIQLVKTRNYDLVFMDHMMPIMDGIEATQAIREWELSAGEQGDAGRRQVPIVALTANVMAGMKETFLEKGFSDFLAKPIDLSKLDEILAYWIPKEKREIGSRELGVRNREEKNSPLSASLSPLPNIPGVDVQKGIAMTGGTVPLYIQVLALFNQDAKERLPFFQTVPNGETVAAFTTQVHALKSASASLGVSGLSLEAGRLEAAGKNGDFAFIRENLAGFAEKLSELIENIHTALEENSIPHSQFPTLNSPLPTPHSLFVELAAALKSQDAIEIDRVLNELNKKPLDSITREALDKISGFVLLADFENSLQVVKGMSGSGNEA